MSVLTDASYGALARTAAAALGAGSPDIARAILAQWQCELGAGAPYPPPRNNPGNIARGLARDLGIPVTVAPGPNPQPGNPIVTYPTAAIGAQAYATVIARKSRYRSALAAARAGDGQAFVRAIGSSGWGTGTSCMLSVYRGHGAPSSGGGSGAVLASARAPANLAELLGHDGTFDVNTGPQVIRDAAAAADRLVAAGIVSAQWKSQMLSYLGNIGVGMSHGGSPRSFSSITFGSDGYAPSPVSDLLDFGWLPVFAINAGVVVVAAYLVLSGLRDMVGGPSIGDAAILAA